MNKKIIAIFLICSVSLFAAHHAHAVASWGLDRIDQRDLPLDANYNPQTTGAAYNIFVIGSGVSHHQDFGSRLVCGWSFDGSDACQDGFGVGTHMASTVAGNMFGVAKSAHIYAVKVVGALGQGSTSSLISALEWIQNNAGSNSIAVLGVSGGNSPAVRTALVSLANSGVPVVVGVEAGPNPCLDWPGDNDRIIRVSVSDSEDNVPHWGARGNCIDIFAPGQDITAAWPTSYTATRTISGPAIAAAHAAGALALAGKNPQAMYCASTVGRLNGLDAFTPNRLLHVRDFGSSGPGCSPSFECEPGNYKDDVNHCYQLGGYLIPEASIPAGVDAVCCPAPPIYNAECNPENCVETVQECLEGDGRISEYRGCSGGGFCCEPPETPTTQECAPENCIPDSYSLETCNDRGGSIIDDQVCSGGGVCCSDPAPVCPAEFSCVADIATCDNSSGIPYESWEYECTSGGICCDIPEVAPACPAAGGTHSCELQMVCASPMFLGGSVDTNYSCGDDDEVCCLLP